MELALAEDKEEVEVQLEQRRSFEENIANVLRM